MMDHNAILVLFNTNEVHKMAAPIKSNRIISSICATMLLVI
jgi:hypothetical protein